MRGRMTLLILSVSLIGFAFFVVAENSEGTSLSEWRMIGLWLNQTGWDGRPFSTSLYSGAYFTTPSNINPYSKVAIVNGYAYYSTMAYHLYQLNASNVSQQIANFTGGSSFSSSPAVVNGYLYIGNFDNKLYQLNATNISQQIASYTTTGASIEGSPVVYNGYVYVGSDDDKLYQLNATNISQLYATYQAGSDFGLVTPAIANGYVYVGSVDDKFYQLNASNVSKFVASYTTGNDILSSAAVYNDFVYVGSKDGLLYQLNASNVSIKYASFNTTSEITYNSVAIANGYVYTGINALYQLNASNVSQQIARLSGATFISGAAYTNGYIYAGTTTGRLYQLNASNVSNIAGYYDTGSTIYSSPSIANGYVYFGNWNNKLYQLNASNLSKVDFLAPNVSIISPTNTTYTSSTVSININMTEQGYCNYSLSGLTYSLTNTSLTEFIGTSSSLSNGDYILTALCSDEAFNLNSMQNVTFTIEIPATTSPGSNRDRGSSRIYDANSTYLQDGHSYELLVNERVRFSLHDAPHMLRLNYFDEQRAGITLSSDPIRLELTRGSEENVDIDSDGNPDIIVVYEGKNNYRAQIHLKEIKTPAPSTSTEQQSSKETSSLPSQSKLPRIIIGLGIIAFILIWFIFTRRKTPQTSLEWLKYNN